MSLALPLLFALLMLQHGHEFEIVAPKNGQIVLPGKPLVVKVSAPGNRFRRAGLMVQDPFPNPELKGPPFEFTIPISADAPSRCYVMFAIGVTMDGQATDSEPVNFCVERAGAPRALKAVPAALDLPRVGETAGLSLVGMFGEKAIDLTLSTKTKYATDNAAVATVDSEGTVTAVAPGKANITISHGRGRVSVTATVPSAP